MTRLISSGRISGRVTETPRCAPGRAIAAALAALFAVLAIGGVSSFAPIGSALAQQAQSADVPEFSTYDLFDEDSGDPRPRPEVLQQLADAIRKAQAPGNCSLGRLKIRVPTGDPLVQPALVDARRDAVLAALDRLGVPVAGRLLVETSVALGPGGTDTVYEPPLDKRPPKLDVIWTPEKGTKVEAGRRITAKATASDDPTQWQTGLKNIKLTVDGGERPFGFEEYPQTCVPPLPPPRTLERFYIVPSPAPPPAPPMVRLRATARDYAGNETPPVWADFPTGDLPVAYVWEGEISAKRVHVSADGVGNWTANYHVRLREDDCSSFSTICILGPLELKYEIEANEVLDKNYFGIYPPGCYAPPNQPSGCPHTPPVSHNRSVIGKASGLLRLGENAPDELNFSANLDGVIYKDKQAPVPPPTDVRPDPRESEAERYWNSCLAGVPEVTGQPAYRIKINMTSGYGSQDLRAPWDLSAEVLNPLLKGIVRSGPDLQEGTGNLEPRDGYAGPVLNFWLCGRLKSPDDVEMSGEHGFSSTRIDQLYSGPTQVNIIWKLKRKRVELQGDSR